MKKLIFALIAVLYIAGATNAQVIYFESDTVSQLEENILHWSAPSFVIIA